MSFTLKEQLEIAWMQGEFARAYAKLVVHNEIDDFAELTSNPEFDIVTAWNETLVQEHIEFQLNWKSALDSR